MKSEIIYISEDGKEYTQNDIKNECKEWLKQHAKEFNLLINKHNVDELYRHIMVVIQWESPCTILDQLDNEEINNLDLIKNNRNKSKCNRQSCNKVFLDSEIVTDENNQHLCPYCLSDNITDIVDYNRVKAVLESEGQQEFYDSMIKDFTEYQLKMFYTKGIDLIDMDRWNVLNNIFHVVLKWETARKIIDNLYTDDIEVLELDQQ